ncbi:nucleotide sugar dehydrogenase [Paenibacillus puerhi]|uniref:nucleotide sugar dehydrogenase n=1 Tax=Paenibacillus puerhi TaxID=2692622 RepID=UPI001356F383|nr:nucleotide sugar dehydrogenase [Paenibacillus puerhi]
MPFYGIGVIGLGYVGLPLARLFVQKGQEVHGIDVDERKIARLHKGESYLSDFTDEEVSQLFKTGHFHVGTSYEAVREVDVIIICVPTPLDEHGGPDLQYIRGAMQGILPYLHKDQLLVLESSTFPGTCDELLKPMLESAGFEVGRDVFLAYSPERIDPGTKWQLEDIPKVVGGYSAACTAYAKQVYESAFHQIVVVSSLRAAEMTKLLENSQRFVNISLMNSLLKLAHRMDISLWEVIDAASTKPFGFTPYYPGAGIGGHCIPVDPLYLLWKAKEQQLSLPFIELSSQVNNEMPAYIAERVEQSIHPKSLGGSRILLIGVTYKKDVNDVRESPALKIISLLQQKGADVSFFDPYVDKLVIDGRTIHGTALTESNVKLADCTLILTDHTGLPYEWVTDHSTLVFDTRNATSAWADRGNIIYL